MPKQQITIEVDVPEGWEAVRYGKPKRGEMLVAPNTKVVEAYFDFQDDTVLVVRRSFVWPSSLAADWKYLTMNADGKWYFSRLEPYIIEEDDTWGSLGGWAEATAFADFQPPPCTDWRQSKRRRPS